METESGIRKERRMGDGERYEYSGIIKSENYSTFR